MARRRGALAREARHCYARTVTHQGALQGLHDHHAQPHRRRRRATPTSIIDRAVRLLDKTDAGRAPVRLLGVSVSGLGAEDEPPPEPPGDPRLPFEA